jgi:hypothetical protein
MFMTRDETNERQAENDGEGCDEEPRIVCEDAESRQDRPNTCRGCFGSQFC